MNALLYLIGAVVVSAAAIAGLNYRQRRPKSLEAGIREFERGLRALDPTTDPRRRAQPGPGETSSGLSARALVPRPSESGSLPDAGSPRSESDGDQDGREAHHSG